jgi:phosphoribosylformylglycinamidine synthase subunit PurSL
VACGINPKLSDVDPYLMAQSVVDEAVRNLLCVGAEFGSKDSVLSLVDNFCWPDPVKDPEKMGALVRTCFGMQKAALALGAPLVSGKDSMKNDYRGKLQGKEVTISVPPTLLMTAVGRVPDIRLARTADFKAAGDFIYLLGGTQLGLWGTELQGMLRDEPLPGAARVGEPDWDQARIIYSWIGGAEGKLQSKLRSMHDLSEGGLLVALAESLLARGLGATIHLPEGRDPWEIAFGEGFHSFVVSATEGDAAALEAEWASLKVPFFRLGTTTGVSRMEVKWKEAEGAMAFGVDCKDLRSAWRREGYWE